MKVPAGLTQLLTKPMDRKDFLKQTAAIALFVAGGGAIVQSVLKGLNFGQPESQPAAMGYGSSAYGGMASVGQKR